jgi:hypothetical protein
MRVSRLESELFAGEMGNKLHGIAKAELSVKGANPLPYRIAHSSRSGYSPEKNSGIVAGF